MDANPVRTTVVETADGRRLRVEIGGDGARVVVAHVGSPNGGVLYEPWVRDAAERGLTLVTYDRPGYGRSTPRPGRTVADCADDVRAIARAVGFHRCAVWGFSGGGPCALACGTLLGDLVSAVATIGSPAPILDMGDDFFDGARESMRADLALYDSDRAEWERDNRAQWEELVALTADELRAAWSQTACPADRDALAGDFGIWLHRALQQGLEPGEEGWSEDDIATFHAPWGFDPADIGVKVKIWHGADDTFVPCGQGRWLAERIPHAESDIREGDGHMRVMAERIGDVHGWLADRL
jgi:pimeloyl-ACP methyl ester carboxylesterase